MDGETAGDPVAVEVQNNRITWEGCSVLLDINDGDKLVFAHLNSSANLKIGNKKCSLGSLIGCPFGSLFQMESGPQGPYLARCDISSAENEAGQHRDDSLLESEQRDNRALVDNNTAQGLSSEDIDAMRREGLTGNEIVEALIANSSTFGTKTAFSQEKYKRRKQKKYAPKVLVRRPFTRSICEAYFKKNPTKIRFMRMDTLSLMLSIANVGAYSNVLVVDNVGGLVTGAVAERLGGTGYVCSTFFGGAPYPMDIVRLYNFSSEIRCKIVQAPFLDLMTNQNDMNGSLESHPPRLSIQVNLPTESVSPSAGADLILQEHGSPERGSYQDKNVDNPFGTTSFSTSEEGSAMNIVDVFHKPTNPGVRATSEAIQVWKRNGFSSLLVSAPELDVDSVVQKLLPLISYSAPFAIYHQYLQPLATCMHRLQTSKTAIGLQISEPWMREYQVLPSRTHPSMQMSGFGGYILSGIRICNGG